jgi:hypothetical protein
MAGAAFTRSNGKAPNRLAAVTAVLLLAAPAARAQDQAQAPQAQVQVQSLAAPDLFSIGAAPAELPPDLWKGSSAALARLVLPAIASRPLTPAAARLARHVLAAAEAAPDGAGGDDDLAGLRAQALLGLGELDVAGQVIDRTTDLQRKPALAQAAAQADLLRGQEDQACAVGDNLAEGRDRGFWVRLRGYCQAKAGQSAPAQLTLELAAQQDPTGAYERLMTALLAGKDAGAPSLDSGLDFAISRRAAAGWAQGLDEASAPVALTVARDASAPLPARLEAAARAVRLGLPVPDDVYAAIQPPPADVAGADQPGAAGEGALVLLARSASDLSVKEGAVVALLRRARNGPELQALARLADPQIVQLLAAGAVLKDPALITLAAAAAGDGASARAARAQLKAPDARKPLPLDLALLDALLAAASGQEVGPAVEALDAQYAPSDAAGRSRAGAAIALLGALGGPVGPQARLDLSAADLGAGAAPLGRSEALSLAASAGRAGDTALYALQTFADAGPAGPAPGERARLVHALAQAGLRSDAQALALEGLVALQARP